MLTQTQIKFLLSALQGLQIRGDRQTVRKTMELADETEQALRAMLETDKPAKPEPKRKR